MNPVNDRTGASVASQEEKDLAYFSALVMRNPEMLLVWSKRSVDDWQACSTALGNNKRQRKANGEDSSGDEYNDDYEEEEEDDDDWEDVDDDEDGDGVDFESTAEAAGDCMHCGGVTEAQAQREAEAQASLSDAFSTFLARVASESEAGSSASASANVTNFARSIVGKWCCAQAEYRTNYGCHRGQPVPTMADMIMSTEWEEPTVHETEADAVEVAKHLRDSSEYFEGWAEEFYAGDTHPPYDSADGENCDNDSEVRIEVMLLSDFYLARKQEGDYVEKELKEAQAKAKKAESKKAKAVAASGRVHYSWPSNPRVDRPADVEAEVCTDGTYKVYIQADKKQGVVNSSGPSFPTVEAFLAGLGKAPAAVRSVMVVPADKATGKAFADAVIALLAAVSVGGLDELHLHSVFSRECCADDAATAMMHRLHTETTLPASLKVLSVPLSGEISPELLENEIAGKFPAMEELSLRLNKYGARVSCYVTMLLYSYDFVCLLSVVCAHLFS